MIKTSLYTSNKYPLNPGSFSNISGVVVIIFLILFFTVTSFYKDIVTPFDNDEFKYDTMEKCVDSSCYQFGITLLVCFIIYIGYYSFYRYFPLASFISVFLLFGLSTYFIFTSNKFDNLFEYIKFFSVSIGAMMLVSLRLHTISQKTNLYNDNSIVQFLKNSVFSFFNIFSKNTWTWMMVVVLSINIIEAVLKDYKYGNYYNVIAGILLVLTIPRPGLTLFDSTQTKWSNVCYVNTKKPNDIVYTTTLFWVIMYTTWNMCFSYSERKEHFAIIVVVLLSALFGNLPNSIANVPYLYIQCRTLTLFARYVILGFDDVYQKYADSSNWYDKDISNYWGLFNMVCYICYICYYLLKVKKPLTKLIILSK